MKKGNVAPRVLLCPGCSKPEAECQGRCMEPDHSAQCSVCGASPVMPVTEMCGVCTFGEADAEGGNW